MGSIAGKQSGHAASSSRQLLVTDSVRLILNITLGNALSVSVFRLDC